MATEQLFDVGNEIVVITGVAGQLGGEYARAFLSRGAQVAGLVRVAWSATWSEYQVRALDRAGRLVGEYFTDDRADALGTADRMLAELASAAGVPA